MVASMFWKYLEVYFLLGEVSSRPDAYMCKCIYDGMEMGYDMI